jgi:hypothetical protein
MGPIFFILFSLILLVCSGPGHFFPSSQSLVSTHGLCFCQVGRDYTMPRNFIDDLPNWTAPVPNDSNHHLENLKSDMDVCHLFSLFSCIIIIITIYYYYYVSMLGGSLLPRYGASSGCGWRRRPPVMEGRCEYIE